MEWLLQVEHKRQTSGLFIHLYKKTDIKDTSLQNQPLLQCSSNLLVLPLSISHNLCKPIDKMLPSEKVVNKPLRKNLCSIRIPSVKIYSTYFSIFFCNTELEKTFCSALQKL